MRWARGLLVALAVVLLPPAGVAHIVVEAPWHPVAHAHRQAVFLINLRPTDWALVERTFTTSAGPGAAGPPAKEQLIELDAATGSGYWPAIEQAIAAQDRDALFAAATRAVSGAIRQHLAKAPRTCASPAPRPASWTRRGRCIEVCRFHPGGRPDRLSRCRPGVARAGIEHRPRRGGRGRRQAGRRGRVRRRARGDRQLSDRQLRARRLR